MMNAGRRSKVGNKHKMTESVLIRREQLTTVW